ncbi:MAG: (Fe-S)-binding protein [Desulfovibrionaceae bacterium]|nr:(Fe-S)-binding protein [Desulfovibrionaceae bacterium]
MTALPESKTLEGVSCLEDVLAEHRADIDICARCGFCKNVCPTYKFSDGFEAYSPRARLNFLRDAVDGKAEFTAGWVDRLFRCTTCERCVEVCQTMIPLVELWEAARARAVREGAGPMPAHRRIAAAVKKTGNAFAEPLAKARDWMLPEHRPAERADLLIFGGCTASYRNPPMLRTGLSILQRADVPYMYLGGRELCCGSPLLRTGQDEAAAEAIRANIDMFSEAGVKRIAAPCAGCSKTLKSDYPKWAKRLGKPWKVEVLHFVELYDELLAKGSIRPARPISKVVTYHDPCHAGRAQGLFREPRAVMAAIPGLKLVEMPHHGPDSRCCGAGGGVKANYPQLAAAIARDRVQEAMDTGAEALVTMCPFCQASFNQAVKELKADFPVLGVDQLLMESMGGADAASAGEASRA